MYGDSGLQGDYLIYYDEHFFFLSYAGFFFGCCVMESRGMKGCFNHLDIYKNLMRFSFVFGYFDVDFYLFVK